MRKVSSVRYIDEIPDGATLITFASYIVVLLPHGFPYALDENGKRVELWAVLINANDRSSAPNLARVLYEEMERLDPTPDAPPWTELPEIERDFYRHCSEAVFRAAVNPNREGES